MQLINALRLQTPAMLFYLSLCQKLLQNERDVFSLSGTRFAIQVFDFFALAFASRQLGFFMTSSKCVLFPSISAKLTQRSFYLHCNYRLIACNYWGKFQGSFPSSSSTACKFCYRNEDDHCAIQYFSEYGLDCLGIIVFRAFFTEKWTKKFDIFCARKCIGLTP